MSLIWQKLRTWSGSQHLAFEELCCQLAAYEEVPDGSKYIRKGTPDGGVECFWKLLNNEEWAWQAKFFESSSKVNWGNLDSSVKRMLETHKEVVKYIFCLPFNPPDSREKGKTSFSKKWDDHVIKWKKWALEKGIKVDFPPFWGDTQIWDRLSLDIHQGRRYFWFNETEFTNNWANENLEVVLADAGERYAPNFLNNPDLNVDLPMKNLFYGLGRTDDFWNKFLYYYKHISKLINHLSIKDDEYKKYSENLLELLSKNFQFHINQIDLNNIFENCDRLQKFSINKIELLRDDKSEKGSTKTNIIHQFFELIDILDDIKIFVTSKESLLSNDPKMLLNGEALIGKTHLFCDVAKKRIENNLPTIIILGQHLQTNDNPWSQIINQLGLSCKHKEFIGAINTWAEVKNTRVILIIDALNEGNGHLLWYDRLPGFLKILDDYPRIGILLSVRNTELNKIVKEDLLDKNLITINHPGFQGVEHIALSTYCKAFNLLMPSIPFIYPAFLNPGFLYLMCKTLNNRGENEIPTGSKGFSIIFEDYIYSLHYKLWQPSELDYPKERNLIRDAINSIISQMVQDEATWIEFEKAEELTNQLLPGRSFSESLFASLLSEGIIIKDRFVINSNEVHGIHFTYQKFENHFIAKYLLDKYLNTKEPHKSFTAKTFIGKLIKDEWACMRNRSLVEAFSTQIPERINKELIEIAPHCSEFSAIRESFNESLIWRNPNNIFSSTLKYINDNINQYKDTQYHFLNTLLTVASIQDHPYNADFLHKNLINLKIAERDAWWSIFLHDEYGNSGAVDRLIKWSWIDEDKSYINKESLRLCGIALSWFLTSSNRFLRDRVTKALVNLFTTHIDVLIKIIIEFLNVNDPYVKERLFAVSYGCALRSADNNYIKDLAMNIYEWIFKDGAPTPHILLRDYARGVIEHALTLKINIDVDVNKIRPPYKSECPIEPPDIEELKELYYKKSEYYSIWGSLMYHAGGFTADFGRYILNSTIKNWSSVKFGEPINLDPQKVFLNTLNSKQIELLSKIDPNIFLESKTEITDFEFQIIDKDYVKEKNELKKNFEKTLSEEQQRNYNKIKSSDNISLFQKDISFDGLFAERWIFQKVIDLGWSPEYFFDVERLINTGYRRPNKAERISKKYQWIAFHELLARISDNYYKKKDSWTNEIEKYDGPWQLSIRDIDPSSCLKNTKGNDFDETDLKSWWNPVSYNSWLSEPKDMKWLQNDNDVPSANQLISVINPKDHSNWLTLEGTYTWAQPTPPEQDKYDVPFREIWYWIKSYIVKKENINKIFNWASKKHFYGRWMPESHELTHVFLGEFYHSSAFEYHNIPYYYHDGWTRGSDNEIPVEVLVTTDQYLQEQSGYDCSIDETMRIYLPSKWIADNMKLNWNGVDGHYFDEKNNLTAFDPTINYNGPSALLINKEKFLSFLNEKGYDILWTLIGEKRIMGGTYDSEDFQGLLELSGAYIYTNKEIKGKISSKFYGKNSR